MIVTHQDTLFNNMETATKLVLQQWATPSSYYGFNPVGDYLVYARNRDSSILENSNFEVLLKLLTEHAKDLPELDGESPRDQWVYTFTASCWAHGWREYLMIRYETTENSSYHKLLHAANSAVTKLKEIYPIMDEDHYLEMQNTAIDEYWENMSIEDRVELCQTSGCSIFAARYNYIPADVHSHLYDSGEFE